MTVSGANESGDLWDACTQLRTLVAPRRPADTDTGRGQ